MIFGYISQDNKHELDFYFKEKHKRENTFRFSFGDIRAYFLIEGTYSYCLYQDPDHLLLCDGIAIKYSESSRYEIINKISKREIKEGFFNIINNIVSNVNMVFFKKSGSYEISLSSDRASKGRIYYSYNGGSLVFSSNFSYLLKFIGTTELDYKAVYSIIRYGAVVGPISISKSIKVLPAGHYAVYDIEKKYISINPYFQFDFSQSHRYNLDFTDKLLTDSSKLLKNSGCSLLLSGGVDSTLLACKISENNDKRIKSYYLKYDEKDTELPFVREIAKRTNSILQIFDMTEKDVFETIIKLARSYDHPFNDFSTIPTFHLMKCAYEDQNYQIMIDGTAGDACFGFGILSQRRWKVLFKLPDIVKKIYNKIYMNSSVWVKGGSVAGFLRTIAKCTERELNLCPLVLCPRTKLFHDYLANYDIEIVYYFVKLIDSMLLPNSYNCLFEARATVADIVHVCSNMFSAKTYGLNSFPSLYTFFPYMWKDILEEQGRLAWSAKTNKGVVKWPLKKILEYYMPHDFIYRRKSGLVPPFEKWFKSKEVYELLKDSLLDHNAVVTDLFNRKRFRNIIENLYNIQNWSNNLCHYLWGMIFVELWINNKKSLLIS